MTVSELLAQAVCRQELLGDTSTIAAAWIMPFCYGPWRAPRSIGSLQAAKALRWQPCTELQASDQSKRNANPGQSKLHRCNKPWFVTFSRSFLPFLGYKVVQRGRRPARAARAPRARHFPASDVYTACCKHGTLQAEPLPILAPSRLDN